MAQLKGKVLAGKVLVKPHEAEAKTASGIIIPDSAKEKPRQGTVILVGAPKKDEEMEESFKKIIPLTDRVVAINLSFYLIILTIILFIVWQVSNEFSKVSI